MLTNASVHDSQVAIPLMTQTPQRVVYLYELMDSAYDADLIDAHSRHLNHVPIIAPHPRRGTKKPSPLTKIFPAKPTPQLTWAEQDRYKERTVRNILWDIRKPFQSGCKRAGIEALRIHDLRHMAATSFLGSIPDAIIRKLTGHRSRELERYEHLSPNLKRHTVELIAKILTGTRTDTPNPGAAIRSCKRLRRMAGTTGFEPATSDVTGRRSNQLNYVPEASKRRYSDFSTSRRR
jgi:hypothetical protein